MPGRKLHAGLESILTKETRRFLKKAARQFEVDDFITHRGGLVCNRDSLSEVLESLAALTAQQDNVLAIARKSSDVGGGFMPIKADDVIPLGRQLAQIAEHKDEVLAFFHGLSELGYGKTEFTTRYTERNGRSRDGNDYGSSVTLRTPSGVIALANEREKSLQTLKEVHERYGHWLPLYRSYVSVPMPTDGILFEHEGFLTLARNLADITRAVREFGIINVNEAGGPLSGNLTYLYKAAGNIAWAGKHPAEVEVYIGLVTGKKKIDPKEKWVGWLVPVMEEHAKHEHLTALGAALKPYTAYDRHGRGVTLDLEHVSYEPQHIERDFKLIRALDTLAASRLGDIVTLARAMHEFGAHFAVYHLATDENAAKSLLGDARELGKFVGSVREHGKSRKQYADDEFYILRLIREHKREESIFGPHKPRLPIYARLVHDAVEYGRPLVELVRELSQTHGLHFESEGLVDVLMAVKPVYDASQRRRIDSATVARDVREYQKTYSIGALAELVGRSREKVA